MTVEPEQLRLRPPSNEVDPRVIPWWRWRLTLSGGAMTVLLVVLGIIISPARFWLFLAAMSIAVVSIPLVVFLPVWWYRVHRWEVTETAVYARSGFFFQESRIAPMSRIQTVDTESGPVEQRFGLATLIVTTASSKGEVTVPGLDREVADDLAHRLADITKLIPQDAT